MSDTQIYLPEIAAKIGYNVGVFTVFHHYNLLLDDSKVLTWSENTQTHTYCDNPMCKCFTLLSYKKKGGEGEQAWLIDLYK